MRRYPGLDQHSASLLPPSSPARHLTEKLEAALGGPEIRQIDSNIGVDDSHQSDIRKIQSLGDHLSSEQDVDFARRHPIENSGVRPLPARRIEIHTGNPGAGKSLAQQSLHLLSAKPALLEVSAAAARTIRPRILLVQAVMADQTLGIAVMSERNAAVRTGCDGSAVDALDER